MPEPRSMTGTSVSDNCDVAANGNAGCGVHATAPNSYGPGFNAAGGGFYVMERTTSFIKVWFWSRGDPTVPSDVSSGAASVNTDAFCDINAHFGAHNIIINLTFCGDWAGIPSFFDQGSCSGDCNTFVNNNPSAFEDAFWDIAAVRVYV
ncbi:putative glycosidase C21B10.07 [Grifola frondosa]|uniref:Putative glycosidase C21B10.07 n=1 Tax=Grifola frondosa TaxID=5627 RepID=A0A1C7MPP9_GRIFR|nr:putative glycosidase C21B10.07 [Grifola frondosa]